MHPTDFASGQPDNVTAACQASLSSRLQAEIAHWAVACNLNSLNDSSCQGKILKKPRTARWSSRDPALQNPFQNGNKCSVKMALFCLKNWKLIFHLDPIAVFLQKKRALFNASGWNLTRNRLFQHYGFVVTCLAGFFAPPWFQIISALHLANAICFKLWMWPVAVSSPQPKVQSLLNRRCFASENSTIIAGKIQT